MDGVERMRIILGISFILLASCSGSDESTPKVNSGDIASQMEAKAFVQQTNSEISPSLQIQPSELNNWKQEGLLTQDEATIIQENL